jgi:hypothetical protein
MTPAMLVRHLFHRSPRTGRRSRLAARPQLELLDERCLLSQLPVTVATDSASNNNAPAGSLRAAILQANMDPTVTSIAILLPKGTHINLLAPLPAVTANNLTISADFDYIDGTNAGNASGLVLKGNGIDVNQLGMVNFQNAGVEIDGHADSLGLCAIGTEFDPVLEPGLALSNGVGVYINQTTSLDPKHSIFIDGCLIGNNFTNGVTVDHSNDVLLNGNVIKDNHVDGVQVLGNALSAPAVNTTTLTTNFIIRNHQDGIDFLNSSGNQVGDGSTKHANFIGCTKNVLPDYANFRDGIRIESSPGTPSANNLIDVNLVGGNDGNGVNLMGAATTNNSLFGNFIGFTSYGVQDQDFNLYPKPNLLDGVAISDGASNNQVGDAFGPNVIGNNGGSGVRISDVGTTQNTVQSNIIGVYFEPLSGQLTAAPNNTGVTINNGSTKNQIGGAGKPFTGLGNVIAASTNDGVLLSGPGTTGNQIQGNYIGTDLTGTTPFGNSFGVVIADGASNNLVGGAGDPTAHTGTGKKAVYTGLGNVISASVHSGVDFTGAGTSGNQLESNFIGVDSSGEAPLPNQDGVRIEAGASDNSIGAGLAGNVISANNGSGVVLTGMGTSGNVLESNKIGLTPSGNPGFGNALDGVLIGGGASDNLVGYVVDLQLTLGNLISGNRQNGVEIRDAGTTGNQVQANKIGSDASGLKPRPNTLNGVAIGTGATANTVGGNTPAAGNLIAGNLRSGVFSDAAGNFIRRNLIGTIITGLGALPNHKDGVDLLGLGETVTDNLISGNLLDGVVIMGSFQHVLNNKIGTNALGNAPVANKHDGVYFDVTTGPGGNILGTPGAGNLISGNGWNGIDATGPPTAGNTIQANFIGTDATGLQGVANTLDGVLINSTTGFTIGGTGQPTGDLIAGNQQDGVEITGPGGTGIVLLADRIGTNVAGNLAVPNAGDGVHIHSGATNNQVGGTGTTDGNLISGNGKDGVLISDYGVSGNQLLGNMIGTNASGKGGLPNTMNGVHIGNGANNNFVGGKAVGARNLISGNSANGVLIDFYVTHDNAVLGNRIGTDLTGLAPLPNQGQGVLIFQSVKNVIGGSDPSAANVISGNAHDGVQITGGANQNQVAGNLIGTDVAGASALPNMGNGVDLLEGAFDNTIGGLPPTTTSSRGNVISGNGGSGVVISGPLTEQNFVEGNKIGTTLAGDGPLGNQGDGVLIFLGATKNQIGGGAGTFGAGNLIAANAGDGVRIVASNANVVQGNSIGVALGGGRAVGNAGHGVFVYSGAQNNTIGGPNAGDGNTIAHNGKAGVAVGAGAADVNTLFNPILSDSIFANQGLGIDLGDDGVTPNKPQSPHSGPNFFQNKPEILSAFFDGSVTRVRLHLNSIPMSTFTLQLFANTALDPTGYGQGMTLVATQTLVPSDFQGDLVIEVDIPQNLAGQFVTATATDPFNDTSEFSQGVLVR